MKALISGQSGAAAILDGDNIHLLRAGTRMPVPASARTVLHVFQGATDIEEVVVLSMDAVRERLEASCDSDHALQFVLSLLDGLDDDHLESRIAARLDAHLADSNVHVAVANRLFGFPLSETGLLNARRVTERFPTSAVAALLRPVVAAQARITAIQREWAPRGAAAFADAVRQGLIRKLCLEQAGQAAGTN